MHRLLRGTTSILGALFVAGCGDPIFDDFVLTSDAAAPREVAGGHSFRSIVAGQRNACGVTTGFQALCWGVSNPWGILGEAGLSQNLFEPTAVGTQLELTLAAPADLSACAIATDSLAHCWGQELSLGIGSSFNRVSVEPRPVAGGHRFVAITVGSPTCGIADDGNAWCWGGGFFGDIGNGANENAYVPALVAGGRQWSALASGGGACGVTTGNALYCWGSGFGDSNTPQAVPGLPAVSRVAMRAGMVCILTVDGKPWCWTTEAHQDSGATAPAAVPTTERFTEIAVGEYHACALSTSSDIWCWGGNYSGQLGDGSFRSSSEPTRVLSDRSFRSVTAGPYYTCAVDSTDRGWCWGESSTLGSEPDIRSQRPR